jgi:FkbM family methyltransferase
MMLPINKMFIIHESSYHSEEPVYEKLNTRGEHKKMFIPEARVAKDYFVTGFYERNILNWACSQFLKSDANVIDVGAHIGWYTIDFAKLAKHVYSFECSPKSFNYLCANIALNECDYKVTKYNVALGSKEGTTDYYIRDPKDGGGNGISKFEYDVNKNTPTIVVPVKTLDSYNLQNVNFIKIDVEGHEKQVLEGAIETIKANNYPKILFESWDTNQSSEFNPVELRKELFEFITSIGYTHIVKVSHDMFVAEKS